MRNKRKVRILRALSFLVLILFFIFSREYIWVFPVLHFIAGIVAVWFFSSINFTKSSGTGVCIFEILFSIGFLFAGIIGLILLCFCTYLPGIIASLEDNKDCRN